jgi:hypothetical protein
VAPPQLRSVRRREEARRRLSTPESHLPSRLDHMIVAHQDLAVFRGGAMTLVPARGWAVGKSARFEWADDSWHKTACEVLWMGVTCP